MSSSALPGARARRPNQRIDTLNEVDYFRHGGILHYVLRQLLAQAEPAGHADSLPRSPSCGMP